MILNARSTNVALNHLSVEQFGDGMNAVSIAHELKSKVLFGLLQ